MGTDNNKILWKNTSRKMTSRSYMAENIQVFYGRRRLTGLLPKKTSSSLIEEDQLVFHRKRVRSFLRKKRTHALSIKRRASRTSMAGNRLEVLFSRRIPPDILWQKKTSRFSMAEENLQVFDDRKSLPGHYGRRTPPSHRLLQFYYGRRGSTGLLCQKTISRFSVAEEGLQVIYAET